MHSVPASHHIAGLDGLRGIAVLSVVVYHWVFFFFPDYFLWISGGFIGVDLFFVLSGFLITWLCLLEHDKTASISISKFYMRRALRLLPALIFLLFIVLIVDLFQGQVREQLLAYFSVLFYFNNWMVYSTLQNTAELGHLWSLSVEEQFYILWPLLLLFLLQRVNRSVAIGILLIVIVGVVIYRYTLWQQGTNWLLIYLRTDMRADSLLLGALGAFAWNRDWQIPIPAKYLRTVCAAGFLLMLHTFSAGEGFYYRYGALLVALLTLVWIFSCRDQHEVKKSYLCQPWLEYLGTRSYGLYLWHFAIFFSFSAWMREMPIFISATVGMICAVILTEVSWRLIEKPFNRRRQTYAGIKN